MKPAEGALHSLTFHLNAPLAPQHSPVSPSSASQLPYEPNGGHCHPTTVVKHHQRDSPQPAITNCNHRRDHPASTRHLPADAITAAPSPPRGSLSDTVTTGNAALRSAACFCAGPRRSALSPPLPGRHRAQPPRYRVAGMRTSPSMHRWGRPLG